MCFLQGQGWIVLPLVFAVSLATELLTETITGDDTYYQNADPPFHLRLSSLEPSAGRWDAARMKASRPLRQSKPKKSGEEVVIELKTHTCMFIRLEFWGPILCCVALWQGLLDRRHLRLHNVRELVHQYTHSPAYGSGSCY